MGRSSFEKPVKKRRLTSCFTYVKIYCCKCLLSDERNQLPTPHAGPLSLLEEGYAKLCPYLPEVDMRAEVPCPHSRHRDGGRVHRETRMGRFPQKEV